MRSLICLWLLWCALHSLLITRTVHEAARRWLGRFFCYYRLCYILFAAGSLTAVLLFQSSLPQHLLFSWPGGWRFVQLALLAYGLGMFYLGSRAFDLLYFFGITQLRQRGETGGSGPFHSRGILRYLRHPWYSGGFALLWACGPLTDVSLVVKLLLSGYLLLGTRWEERRLTRELGPPYVTYCHNVPRFVPDLRKLWHDLRGRP